MDLSFNCWEAGFEEKKVNQVLTVTLLQICLSLYVCMSENLKVGLSPSKNMCVICLIESPLKMIKNAFYFILKVLFVLKIFKFLSRLFDHVGKTT